MAILEIEVIENNNSPKIYLSREIDIINDFDNIDERPNMILFIMDLEQGWKFLKDKAILKVRFSKADEMKEKLAKYKDAVTVSHRLNFTKVHSFEVDKKDATQEKEYEIKEKLKLKLLQSINLINAKADQGF